MTASEGRWDYTEGDDPEQYYDKSELERARTRLDAEKGLLDKTEDSRFPVKGGMDYQTGQEEEELTIDSDEDLKALHAMLMDKPIEGEEQEEDEGWGSPEETAKDIYDLGHPEEAEEEGTDGEEETITGSGGADVAMREIEDNYNRASKQMSSQKEDPYQEYEWQKGQENQKDVTRTCPNCGFYTDNEDELHSHQQDHVRPPKAQEDFPFEEERTTVVTEEPDLLQNVNTDVLEIEGEQYNPEEKYDKKAEEARTISNYVGATQTKAGESIQNILEGAIDVPIERESVNETIYNRKLDGYHEDKIARELAINHNIEYNEAIEKIRGIEVNYNDITAKTLFGKKFAECNETEISEMKILGGEAKKSSMGKRDGRRK